MEFKNDSHEERYQALMHRMKHNDAYHRSAAYLMSLVPMVADDVFDFQSDCIKHRGLFADWQTCSSRKATRLMFNLWNGTSKDMIVAYPETTTNNYAVDEIFSDYEYAPWFYIAIKIRFEWN